MEGIFNYVHSNNKNDTFVYVTVILFARYF